MWEPALRQRLDERSAQQLYRHRQVVDGQQGPELHVDGHAYLAFCSNDYLGLAGHLALIKAAHQGLDRYGVGSGASHLVCGHSTAHHALEEALAEFTGRPRALLFSTGYMANMGAICALIGRGDAVLEDRLNHASLLDAGLLSGARFQRYQHADANDLSRKLTRIDEGVKLVVTDGVFSMDGDLAPLPELARLCQENDAALMVDDAHGLGVLGERGRGCVEHFGLGMADVPILMGTLGKALGSFGAFIAGSDTLIEGLIQFARPYIYTTAMPAAVAEATRAALLLVDQEPWRRQHLATLISRFRQGAAQLGLPLMASDTAIQPLLVGDAGRAMSLAKSLKELGIWITAIRPPTVPAGSSRLRITLSAAHTEAHVDRLLSALDTCMSS